MPTVANLRTADPIELFTINLDEHGVALLDPVAVSADGIWYIGLGLTDEGDGWGALHIDGTTGEREVVPLPISAADTVQSIVVDGVLWSPVVRAAGAPAGRRTAMLRFVLADRTFDLFDSPARMWRLSFDGATVWAEDKEARTIAGWNADGPIGAPIASAGESGEAIPGLLTPVMGGVFDCRRGEWGFTPSGGARARLPIVTDGCGTMIVDGGLLVAGRGALTLLRADGTVADIAVPAQVRMPANDEAVGEPWLDLCQAPAQQGEQVLVMCRTAGFQYLVLDVDLTELTATMQVVFDDPVPRWTSASWQVPQTLSGTGRLVAFEFERNLTDLEGVLIGDVTAPGRVEWTYVNKPRVGYSYVLDFGDSVLFETHTGQPGGDEVVTWYEILAPA